MLDELSGRKEVTKYHNGDKIYFKSIFIPRQRQNERE